MKKNWIIFLFIIASFGLKSQTIVTITFTPANPNPGDTITIQGYVTYPATSCPQTKKAKYFISPNDIVLQSFRCSGMLLANCNALDTFKIVLSTSGIYNFHYMPGIDTNGTCYKPLYANNQPYQYPSAIKTIQIAVGTQIGIAELFASQLISVFPNPVSNTLYILNENKELENSEVLIINTLGQIVSKKPFSSNIDVSGIPKGYYFLRITTTNKKIFHSKFVRE